MDGTQTSPADTPGAETNKPVETPKESLTPLQKITADNEAIEAGLIKGRELEAERLKLEANKQLGGETGGNVEVEKKEETPKEYRDRIDKEIAEGQHAG